MTGNEPQPTAHRWWAEGVYAGRIFGVPIYFAPSWFVIAAFVTWQFGPVVQDQVPTVGDVGKYVVAGVFALLLYASVLVHELSHSVVAKGLGLPVRRIVLQLLGGVSEIVREPETAAREYLVAVAGPLTSILLAGAGRVLWPLFEPHTVARTVLFEFTVANAIVAVFNLLPGLPLDGGRVLRAALWQLRRDKLAGTRAAAWFGRGLAVALALAPIAVSSATGSRNVSLSIVYFLILATFLWFGATQSLVSTQVSTVLPHLSVRGLTRRALPVTADLPVSEAVRRARESGSRALVVVDGMGRPDALVSESAVGAVPENRRPWVAVGSLAKHIDDDLVLQADLHGSDLLDALRHRPASEYLVVEPSGAVFGVLAQADVAAALQGSGRP